MKTRNKTAIFCISFVCASFAQAQPAIYKDEDYKLGEKLIAESKKARLVKISVAHLGI
jgi:hypothetical protein